MIICNICNEEKSADDFYKYNKKKASGEEYLYFHPYCKECTSNKAMKWAEKNPENIKASKRKYNKTEYAKRKSIESEKRRREQGLYSEWQRNNKNKLKEYGHKRNMNKKHDISECEWLDCLDFFNYSCAYCDLQEQEHIELYGQYLHKEHVEHNGTNDITNCVPSCKVCNSKKWEYELNEWYNEENPVYNKQRYNKIIKWLMSFAAEDYLIKS